MTDWLTIGQFSDETGLTPKALRLYESMGLLRSHTRGENRYHYYQSSQIPVGLRLKELKALGFSLQEVKALIGFDETLDVQKLISAFEARLISVSEQIRDATEQKSQIAAVL